MYVPLLCNKCLLCPFHDQQFAHLLHQLGCGIFGFCLLSFPQKERKIYKLRELTMSQFVYFLSTKQMYFGKVNIDGSALKKYTKWDKLNCLSLYIFLSFWGNERRQKQNIPHLTRFFSIPKMHKITLWYSTPY